MGTDGGDLREHVAATIATLEPQLERAIYLGLHRLHNATRADECKKRARAITARLLAALPEVRARLAKDVLAAFDSDPAASGIDEIVACYPGLYAIAIYRVANRLLALGAEVRAAHADGVRALAHRHRHPPGRDDRRVVLHRPRHRHRDRRDQPDRRPRAHLPGRDAGRAVGAPPQPRRQGCREAAPPDDRGRRHDLRQRDHPGRRHGHRPRRGRRRQRLDHVFGAARHARRNGT